MLSFGKGSKKPPAKGGKKEVRRLLLVTLVDGRDLIACSNDATSDPFVLLSIAQGDRDLESEAKCTSSIQRKTIHPEWKQSFTFGENCNMKTDSDGYTLVARVFHKRSFLSSDELIGVVRIPLASIDAMGSEADSWYNYYAVIIK
jgi:Ca2+-dependent lipid-binding protein